MSGLGSAADYPLRFTWQQHSYGVPSSAGDRSDQYAAAAYLWGGYQVDRSGTTTTLQGGDQQRVRATIRLRNYPAVGPRDQLTDPYSGEVWTVDYVSRGDNEMLAEAFHTP